MHQSIIEDHFTEGGVPAGGITSALGLQINWQDGPLMVDGQRREMNGCFVETVINAALGRLRYYQSAAEGRFACRQNALAITKLEEALHWLDDRTREREQRGVEGTHQP